MDVIHTDGESILSLLVGGTGFGMSQPCGHKDFYPNGGSQQPGCRRNASRRRRTAENIRVLRILRRKRGIFSGLNSVNSGVIAAISCSHGRAVEYFIESLRGSSGGRGRGREGVGRASRAVLGCQFTARNCTTWQRFLRGKCDDEDDDDDDDNDSFGTGAVTNRQGADDDGKTDTAEFVDLCGIDGGGDGGESSTAATAAVIRRCDVMGIDASAPPAGIERMKLYLKTGSEAPFCLGQNGVMVKRQTGR